MFKSYRKAKRMVIISETKDTLEKLYYIKNQIESFQKMGHTHVKLYKSSGTWDLAKKIFHNEHISCSGFSDNANWYSTHYFGLLKLKFLIWWCERKLHILGDE